VITIAVITAGMSEDSATARLGHAVEDALRAAAAARGAGEDIRIAWVDLRPLAHPIMDALLTGFPAGDLAQAVEAVRSADALVALTPTYQASYSGLFKSFLDILEDGTLDATPVLLGATGGSSRHSLVTETAMRPVFIHMHADPVATAVYAATEDWGAPAADSSGRDGSRLSARVRRAADELIDRLAGHTVRTGRAEPPSSLESPAAARTDDAAHTRPARGADEASARDAFPDFVDFETLMTRGGVR